MFRWFYKAISLGSIFSTIESKDLCVKFLFLINVLSKSSFYTLKLKDLVKDEFIKQIVHYLHASTHLETGS